MVRRLPAVTLPRPPPLQQVMQQRARATPLRQKALLLLLQEIPQWAHLLVGSQQRQQQRGTEPPMALAHAMLQQDQATQQAAHQVHAILQQQATQQMHEKEQRLLGRQQVLLRARLQLLQSATRRAEKQELSKLMCRQHQRSLPQIVPGPTPLKLALQRPPQRQRRAPAG